MKLFDYIKKSLKEDYPGSTEDLKEFWQWELFIRDEVNVVSLIHYIDTWIENK